MNLALLRLPNVKPGTKVLSASATPGYLNLATASK